MEKSEILKDNLVKINDILNSQESIMEKIGVLQVELFDNPDAKLEKELESISDLAGSTYSKIKEVKEEYQHTNQIVAD